MENSDQTRRDRLTLEAINPKDGKPISVYIPQTLIVNRGKRSFGEAYTIRDIIPYVLKTPTSIFEGLRDERDEDRTTSGWRCYCGIPSMSYNSKGESYQTKPGLVFLVFVNSEHVVYNWRWEQADQNHDRFPEDHENRFRDRIL